MAAGGARAVSRCRASPARERIQPMCMAPSRTSQEGVALSSARVEAWRRLASRTARLRTPSIHMPCDV
eukprot:2368841-Prymnesium_polylepis.1